MPMIVNTNVPSLNAQRNLSKSQNELSTALQRLSSGLRINSAKDDAAGLFIAEQMTRDVRGSNQAIRNAADGISVGQTGEGAMGEISGMLQRMREIAVQSATGTITNRVGLKAEVDQLQEEIKRIVDKTNFNGTNLLNGTGSLTLQVGSESGDTVTISAVDLTSIVGYAVNSVDVSSSTGAVTALDALKTAIDTVSEKRATFGAVMNRFEAVISNLKNATENITAARSRILDADFAEETAKLTRAQILQQAGVSILAQANAIPQSALSLLQ